MHKPAATPTRTPRFRMKCGDMCRFSSARLSVAETESPSPANRTGRRPLRSETGPQTTRPSAKPRRKMLSVNCTDETPAPNVCCNYGMAGRLMSIESEVRAVSAASRGVKILLFGAEVLVLSVNITRWV